MNKITKIPLGPFELHYPIAQGGMAEVWYAVHKMQGTPVAIKVMLGEHARDPQFCEAFRNEVRTIAGLEHPNILLVFDYGEISEEAQEKSNGKLLSGSPYLAMELASGGTLAHWGNEMDWPQLKDVLLQVLDSLAHAHARGVVHLDLKPGNILMSSDSDVRAGLKLSDFGISVVISGYKNAIQELGEDEPKTAAGTPSYMAPEQFSGDSREYGPWTDLYALGCMAYRLITGNLPFQNKDIYELMMEHLTKPPPPLRPKKAIPIGLEAWIHQLLEKKRENRFQRAADAAWALLNLGPADESTLTYHDNKSSIKISLDFQADMLLKNTTVDDGHTINVTKKIGSATPEENTESKESNDPPTKSFSILPIPEGAPLDKDLKESISVTTEERTKSTIPNLSLFAKDPFFDRDESNIEATRPVLQISNDINDIFITSTIPSTIPSTDSNNNESTKPSIKAFFEIAESTEENSFENTKPVPIQILEQAASTYANENNYTNINSNEQNGSSINSIDTENESQGYFESTKPVIEIKNKEVFSHSNTSEDKYFESKNYNEDPQNTKAVTAFSEKGQDGLNTTNLLFNKDLYRQKLAPKIPSSWHRAQTTRSMQFIGTGLNLFGLRSIPLVGRNKERDILWDKLKETHDAGTAKVLVLQGSVGAGKSRLVEWIAERAHEVGAANLLKAVHTPTQSGSIGITQMLQQDLRCTGLSSKAATPYIRKYLKKLGETDEFECRAIKSLIWQNTKDSEKDDPSFRIQFSSSKERFAVIQRHIERISRERPVILWLDDIQWGDDAINLADYLLDTQSIFPIPVLIVLTVQDEALAERATEQATLEKLMKKNNVEKIHIALMEEEDQVELVHELLCLEENLATKVVKRTLGNPLFSVQLVGDWVQRGLLQVTEQGFALAEGAEMILPDNIHEVWHSRINKIIDGHPKELIDVLEIAAVLGYHVNVKEWQSVCKKQGLNIPSWLLEALLSQKLATVVDEVEENGLPTIASWSFIHGMQRESLLRVTKENNKFIDYNAVSAEMLSEKYIPSDAHTGERIARHFVASNNLEKSLQPYLQSAKAYLTYGEYQKSFELLDEHEKTISQISQSNTELDVDINKALNAILKVHLYRVQGKFDLSIPLCEKTILLAENKAYKLQLAELFAEQAFLLSAKGKTFEAINVSEKAFDLYTELDNNLGKTQALMRKGHAFFQRGEITKAIPCFEKAVEIAQTIPHIMDYPRALQRLSECYTKQKRIDQAIQVLSEAKKHFEKNGDRFGLSLCYKELGRIEGEDKHNMEKMRFYFDKSFHIMKRIGANYETAVNRNTLADVERFFGNLEEAESSYKEAASIFNSMELRPHADGCILNMAIIRLLKSDYQAAITALSECEEGILSLKQPQADLVLYISYGLCYVARNNLQLWDETFIKIKDIIDENIFPDLVDSWPVQKTAEMLLSIGDKNRAKETFKVALKIWNGLQEKEKQKEVSDILNSNIFNEN